jgi:hypothetical protein
MLDSVVDRLRQTFTDHRLYGNLAAEIPEPMLQQLAREGLFRSFVQYAVIGLVALLAVPLITWWVSPIIVCMVAYYYWRGSVGQCVERECLYRRQHGKWRWER